MATYAGIVAAIVSGALVWFVLLRLLRALDANDAQRLLNIGRLAPVRFRWVWDGAVGLLTHTGETDQPRH
jgi:hypothetical protein